MASIDERVEKWKKKLLDLSKRNRLINFKETKRSNISFTSPNYVEIYERLVIKEESLTFAFPLKTIIEDDGEEKYTSIQNGDFTTNKSINEQQKTLKVLRGRAKTSMDEQGINSLFLTFGIMHWKESEDSDVLLAAPLVLVPVTLKLEAMNVPYTIQLHEDEIVINPSLIFKFENDYGITFPNFEGSEDNIEAYIEAVMKIASKNDWQVTTDVHLTLLSFLKINMYKDLENSKDRLVSNSIIKALNGDMSEIDSIPNGLQNYNHDRNTRPIETFQVVDADSSQQDAILLSKNKISFVLQGPPGTGKSQTITNIIAEALSDGKKVLFVSEKAAALEVVKKRLYEAGLGDFCLILHSFKANKKDILKQLERTLVLQKSTVREEALFRLTQLEQKRDKLNEYHTQLHSICKPLNITIFEANGRLASLCEYPDVIFNIENVANTDLDRLNKYKYLLNEYVKIIGRLSENYISNPWYNCRVIAVTHELRHDIESILPRMIEKLSEIVTLQQIAEAKIGASIKLTYSTFERIILLFKFCAETPEVPYNWLSINLDDLTSEASIYKSLFDERIDKQSIMLSKYSSTILKLNANEILLSISEATNCLRENLNPNNYCNLDFLILNSQKLFQESVELKDFIKRLNNILTEITSLYGLSHAYTINDALHLKTLTSLICNGAKPLQHWLWHEKITKIRSLSDLAISKKELSSIKELTIQLLFPITTLSDCNNKVIQTFINKNMGALETVSIFLNKTDIGQVTFNELSTFYNEELPFLNQVSNQLTTTLDAVKEFCDITDTNEDTTISGILKLEELMENIIVAPKPTEYWFDDSKETIIDRLIVDYIEKYEFINQETSLLLANYQKEILSLDCSSILLRFRLQYSNASKYLKSSYYNDKKSLRIVCKNENTRLTDHEIINILSKVAAIKVAETWVLDNKNKIESMLGGMYFDSYTDWDAINRCRNTFKSIKSFFTNGKIPNKLKHILLSAETNFVTKGLSIIKLSTTPFNIEKLSKVLNINVPEFTVQHIIKMISITQFALNNINEDILLLSTLAISANKLKYSTIEDFETVCSAIETKIETDNWFKENEVNLKDSFGEYYVGERTDWQEISIQVSYTEKIILFFGKKNISPKFINFICGGSNEQQFSLIKVIDTLIGDIEAKSINIRCGSILSICDIDNAKLDTLINELETISNKVEALYQKYSSVLECTNTLDIDSSIVYKDLKILQRVQEIDDKFTSEEARLKYLFCFKYQGQETDWQNILDSIIYTHELKRYISFYGLSNNFISDVCQGNSTINWCNEYSEQLKKMRLSISHDFEWYLDCFDNSEIICEESFHIMLDRLKHALNNLALLEEWIDFRSIRKQCNQFGLDDYVKKIEEIAVPSSMIEGAFFKRFYRLWLDLMIPNFPAILSFRGRTHQLLIREFEELDLEQLKIARLRILERLMARLPNTDFATASIDEVGILKREISKQKKIKPLRRLFKEIPNLLTALKPCLMMSPLSVSMYLQAEGYDFDLVIFDEASQVCTEDAVGAIMRGKQVIIAGDRHQLPPTSFFAASVSDAEYDSDDNDEFEDFGAYDSILEEASIAMPERTLKWHYRSRHEHLIAFSNAKIYNHDLITFPSSTDKLPDHGVEYVFVENGVYDRGGKKHNLNEAKYVAKLVFDHFKKHPKRSIGVVTFSEAQQQAIDTALTQMRMQNGMYDQFFTEDGEQPFFIKNLENVQGDERDTIIFSIGYAKDQQGQMYMNFGPLSRNGGHRRLNVAITRAKYNIKLVGSIHPTDIRTESTNAEGVKLLRQYIEFAINGVSSIQNELHLPGYVDVESPFEESVYDFLSRNGFKVKTQVGCSGYRLDMAIEHPTINGIFVLGVECDGATYHSSRTARERDRLRQTILEDIGWTIYRIWSTDWIKDQKTEGTKLLEAVKIAISNYQLPFLSTNIFDLEEEKTIIESNPEYLLLEKSISTILQSDNPYGFEYEKITSFSGLNKDSEGNIDLSECITLLVANEYPIHYELICKRLAPLFGNEKATVKIKREVDYVLKSLSSVTRKSEYFYPSKYTKIIPKAIGNTRSVEYISSEELAEAMKTILNKSFGIERSALYVFTARAFGFNRTGGNISSSMEVACELLLTSKRVKEIDGKLICISFESTT